MPVPAFLLWFAGGLAIGLLAVGLIVGVAKLFSWLRRRGPAAE